MSKRSSKPIHTRLQPGAESQPSISRFNGFPAARKPLKRFLSCSSGYTGLKPGVNESAFWKPLFFALILLTLSLRTAGFAAQTEDAEYEAVADAPRAWLSTVTTRLAINHVRSARVRRETYPGTWLPEPLLTDPAPDASQHAETADSLSMPNLIACNASTIVSASSTQAN